MYKRVVLIVLTYVPDQERINAAVDIDEAPEFVEHGLVESDTEDDLLKHGLRLSGNH